MKNMGTDDALNVTGVISSTNECITLIDSTTNFGTIASGTIVSNEEDPFILQISPETPMGYIFSLDLYVETGGDYLIWDPDETSLTGPFLYPNNYVISSGSNEATSIVNYLTQHGGNVFLEGGDVWYYDPLYMGGFDFGPSYYKR